MGAGASTASPVDDDSAQARTAQAAANAIEEAAQIDSGVVASAAQDAAAATASATAGDAAAVASDVAQEILGAVPTEAKEEAAKLVATMGDMLSSQQMKEASDVILKNVKSAPGATSAVCTCIGGACVQVAGCAPEVAKAMNDALAAIGPALGRRPAALVSGVAATDAHERDSRAVSRIWNNPYVL